MPHGAKQIWTIGHSNRASDELIDLLANSQIELLADVRRFPASRAQPQFNSDEFSKALGERGIDYVHLLALGGRRSTRLPDSPNTAWRVDSFNRYADYMATADFQAGLTELTRLADERRTAIMCSEAVPWRCHRRLIGDALLVRGWQVHDIIGAGRPKPHVLTPFAQVSDERLTYPGETPNLRIR